MINIKKIKHKKMKKIMVNSMHNGQKLYLKFLQLNKLEFSAKINKILLKYYFNLKYYLIN